MEKQIIGITFHQDIKDTYGDAVVAGGGIPLFLSPATDTAAALSLVQGILFTGGGDVWPGFFGESINKGAGVPDMVRDVFELDLAALAAASSLPIMGICRGMQVINIALGGTVYQDIGREHFQKTDPLTLSHEIEVSSQSHLFSVLKRERLMVNSFHHQSVDKVAPVLRAVAFSADGIIEAIEGKNILGLQWHPEWLCHRETELGIFRDFIGKCRNYNDNKQKTPTNTTS
ncbi:MAG: gamma-glutamyl-gamma-aminobutyrate hydrolase family protein [Bacillota bacterium]|nr:gamma-glutamyl-gamma-aminobutyrate hydrolase family protein [Bacillota bacterium]